MDVIAGQTSQGAMTSARAEGAGHPGGGQRQEGQLAGSLGCSPASVRTDQDFLSLTPSRGEGGEGQHPLAQGAGLPADTHWSLCFPEPGGLFPPRMAASSFGLRSPSLPPPGGKGGLPALAPAPGAIRVVSSCL